MKAGEITDAAIEAMRRGGIDFIRMNYPNGDMVGHTGNLLAVEVSVEAVDLAVGRLMETARETGAIVDDIVEVGDGYHLDLRRPVDVDELA